jgi:hypothetical protein
VSVIDGRREMSHSQSLTCYDAREKKATLGRVFPY